MVKKVKTSSKAKKSTKTSKAKSKSKAKATPVVAAPVAPVAAAPATPPPPSLTEDFSQLLAHLAALRSQLTAVTAQVRTLQKRSERELKNALKANKKRQRKAGNRAPSGFVKPTRISKELASFLGKPHGTEMARTEVTREINAYIRTHNLQDPKNGRVIRADSKLRKLLKLNKEDELTYFNLQRYMSPHFAKSAKAKAAAAAASS